MTAGVAILGSTGSIGRTALAVVGRHGDRFAIAALTAHNSAGVLAEQVERWRPEYVGLVSEAGARPGWRTGREALTEAAALPSVQIVVNAIVGAAGLDATLAALRLGKRVALANKESLVMGGELVMEEARRGGGSLVPIDSEHSAILQCLAGRTSVEVRRVILTASGGPFRDWSEERIGAATREDALRHPTWVMGRKITVDSATLANKALEVIEAHHLFGLPFEKIEVVVHPQSVVHSFVEFVDGSVVAQLGVPSMELPILYALTHPERVEDSAVPAYDPVERSPLTFEKVRASAFPALGLGITAGKRGGAAPAVFNAANEEAVARFLEGTLRFREIPASIESALEELGGMPGSTRDELVAADAAARLHVRETVGC
jgi:1-deoxy-D-xylulose-5-phosphate reductoisomerase